MIKKEIRSIEIHQSDDVGYKINVDCRPANEALLNSAGWIANEISLLIKLNNEGKLNEPYAQSVINGLNELPTPQVDNSGKSNREIIQTIIPKYVGTLSEYQKWIDTLPLSDTERALLDEQAKKQFVDDDVSVGDEKSVEASAE